MKQLDIFIVGTGDYAEAAYFLLTASGRYNVLGFCEEALYRKKPGLCNLPIDVLETIEGKYDPKKILVLVAVGPNRVNSVRERLYLLLKQKGYSFIRYIDPSAYVWSENAVGENSFIFPNCVVEPFATIGNNSVMWSGSVLAHHSTIGDHCFLGPNCAVSGRTVVKNNCFLGINCTVRDNITIAERCIIGGGAVVKKNTRENGVYSATGTSLYNEDSFNTKV